jgi:molecular chaperone DnaK
MAQDNKTIGKFHLSDIPPSPRGVPKFVVKFDIDANVILNVNAKDKATGKEQSIRIEASSGLSDKDIEKMVNDAKKNEGVDKERREKIDLQNQAEHLIYETEKNIKENGDKISKSDLSDLKSKVEDLKNVKDASNLDDIKSNMEKLNASWAAIASKMQNSENNKQGEKQNGENKNSSEKKSKNDNIEDADFEVVD